MKYPLTDFKQYRCILFDMDGTLVDSMPYWRRLGRDYLLSRGCQPEEDLEKKIAPMTLLESATYFRDHFGLDETPEQVIEGFKSLMDENYRLRVPAKPGAVRFVRSLFEMGVPLSVCSATPTPMVKTMLDRIGILPCFRHITSCEEAGAGKDRPDAFLQALEKENARPEEALLFEDADFAVKTAKALGMHVISVFDSTCRKTPEEMARMSDDYIRSFEEFF